jgi:hypothetical protein
MTASRPLSSVHFLVAKREPSEASSQQYCVFPPRVSGCIPTLFARLSVSAEGADWSALGAGVWAAVGAALGAVGALGTVADASDLAALAGGAGEAACWAKQGKATDRNAPITKQDVENFTIDPL